MAAPPSVLVLGAGELGRAMLDALHVHPKNGNTSISVLLRTATIASQDATKQKDIASLKNHGIQIVAGDIVEHSEEQLAATLGKYDTVINATGMYAPPGTQTRLCKAAIDSGCRRYFPWQFGVDYDVIGPNSSQNLFTEQLAIRGLLREQCKMEWVIVSTGMFTSFLFEPALDLVNAARDTVTAIGSWENSITVTSPSDIGRLTAEIALATPEVQGVVYTAGDTVSMARLAEIVEGVMGKEIKRVLKTVPQLREELAQDPKNGTKKYRVVFGEGVGVSWEKEKTFNMQRSIKVETAEEWAMANLTK